MQDQTQASLDKSREFLNDCVEASHLLLKRKLEALRRGEEIDWQETRDIVREGRAAARQLTQIASLEVRDRQQSARRENVAGPRPVRKLEGQPTAEMAARFIAAIMEWRSSPEGTDMPDSLRNLILELGLDPEDRDTPSALFDYFETVTGRVAA
jgi:hypothetical protein